MLRHLQSLRDRVLHAIACNAEVAGRVMAAHSTRVASRATEDDFTIWHYWNGQRWEPRTVTRREEATP